MDDCVVADSELSAMAVAYTNSPVSPGVEAMLALWAASLGNVADLDQ